MISAVVRWLRRARLPRIETTRAPPATCNTCFADPRS